MPSGKPAGVRCIQLSDDLRCMIFGHEARPMVCAQLQASQDMCGAQDGGQYARVYLARLEKLTAPD